MGDLRIYLLVGRRALDVLHLAACLLVGAVVVFFGIIIHYAWRLHK